MKTLQLNEIVEFDYFGKVARGYISTIHKASNLVQVGVYEINKEYKHSVKHITISSNSLTLIK